MEERTFTQSQIINLAQDNGYEIADTPINGVTNAILEVTTDFDGDTETLWEFQMVDEDEDQIRRTGEDLDDPRYTLTGDYSDEFHVNPKDNPFSAPITKEQAQARLLELKKREYEALCELASITPYMQNAESIARLVAENNRVRGLFDKLVRTYDKINQEITILRAIAEGNPIVVQDDGSGNQVTALGQILKD